MLSVLDLLDAETLDLDLVAFLMSRVNLGDSFLVGARPGGAGKTTVMCALLNLLPLTVRIVPATATEIRNASKTDQERRCVVCHEIGAGPYFAYLWGEELRRYCGLFDTGHMLATNLHTDDLDEAHYQICTQNGVPEQHFRAFRLQIFLRVEGDYFRSRRRIDKVYFSDGVQEHRLVFDSGSQPRLPSGPLAELTDTNKYNRCRSFLEEVHASDARTIEEVRTRVAECFS